MDSIRQAEADLESEMIDLSFVDFDQLEALPESAFLAALHRVLRENGRQAEAYAGFQSVLGLDE